MSKCHVQELSKVWRCILKDATQAFPRLATEFERDLIRCERLVKARGLRVFLLDFPAVGKHLDRCLSNGEYNPCALPATSRAPHGVLTPKFLGGLYLLIFDRDGRLKEEPDITAICFLRQLLLFAKKYKIECPKASTTTAVVEMFTHDATLPEPRGFWSDPNVPVHSSGYTGFATSMPLALNADGREHRLFLTNLDKVSRLVSSTLGSYDPKEWRFKHGPGAIAETTGPSNKFCWSNWSDRLERIFPIADYGYHSYSSWARDATGGCTLVGIPAAKRREIGSTEPSSRLVAVPKTYAGPRLIAAEPSEHMWCQQSMLSYMSTRVSRSWIRAFVVFDDQSQNQTLCTLGSVTGSLATIDLSMASDCVTPDLVGNMFRSNPTLLAALRASRTLCVSQQLTDKVSETLVLKKFSTMGNAYTFPVESLAFLCISLAAILTDRKQDVTLDSIMALDGEVSVFGDDLIIPADSREAVCTALEMLHFKVNTSKSFWNGLFRESCGVDSFRGHNVTPIYYRTQYSGNAKSLSSVLATRNAYYGRYMLHTAGYLESTLPRNLLRVAPGSGAIGLVTRGELDNDHLMVRYNTDLHRHELRALTVRAKQTKTKTDGDYALLQYFTERPAPTTAWEHGYVHKTVEATRRSWVGSDTLVAQARVSIPVM